MQLDAACCYECCLFEDSRHKDISNILDNSGCISGYAFCREAESLPYQAFEVHDCSLFCDYDVLSSNLRIDLYFQWHNKSWHACFGSSYTKNRSLQTLFRFL
jgi:hypothetical protein